MIVPEKLAHARFVRPSTIKLEFADGQKFSMTIGLLDMPSDQINWPTLKESPGGEKVVVKGRKGNSIPIDSATLRYLVDDKYAAKIDKSISDLHMTLTEQEECSRLSKLTRDPRWYDVGDEDDLFE